MEDALIALDCGTHESAILSWNGESIGTALILPNEKVLAMLDSPIVAGRLVVFEFLSCYGARVGNETFQTLRWIGRMEQKARDRGAIVKLPERREIVQHFGVTGKGKDSAIIAVLTSRFGPKGTAKKPGVTHKLSKHLWQAFACAVFAFDNRSKL